MNENATIIGFDLGHGETALASTRLATTDEPKILSVNGTKTIPTIVGREQDGRVVIGEVAGTRTAALVESYERFKSGDFTDGGRSAKATRLFVRGIIEALLREKQVDEVEKTHFFVGHPSGWTAAAVAAYRSILISCGLTLADVVPESRAAFIHARESGELHLSMDELSSRVLIIDFGSSTTDFTAAIGLNTKPLDFGHSSLGAGIIEGLIMRRVTELSADPGALKAALARLPGKATELAHKCRIAKERYFNREKVDTAPVVEDIIKIEKGISVDIELDRSVMDAILAAPSSELDGMSWRQALDDCLTKCHRQVGDPDLIILTGGAARMGFVKEAVEASFSQSRIATSQEPEFAIAKGLALYGRLLLKTTAFRHVIDELVQTAEFAAVITEKLPALIKRQAAAVGDSLANGAVRPAIVAWRENPADVPTIHDIGQRIAVDATAWTQGPEAKTLITGVVVDWMETIRIRLEIMTDPVCDRFGLSKRALSLSGYTILDASGTPIAAPDVIGDVSVVQTTASTIATVFAAKVMMALHLLFSAHPIGWAIAMVASIVGAIVGVEEAKKILQGVFIPGFVRRLLISDAKIDQMVADASSKIRDQLEQELTRSEASAAEPDKLAARLRTQIGLAIRHRADDAILLLR